MRRVALIAYWYPPHNVIGALRSSKLAKYLPEFGWAPVVVTVEPAGIRHVHPPLPEEPLPAGEILRTRDRSLHAWLERRVSRSAAAVDLEHLTFDSARASGRAWLTAAHWLYHQIAAFPDEVWPWRFEYRRIVAAVREARVDAIVSTSPPATAHTIAARLAADLRVPWIADFRDLWSKRPTRRRVFPLDCVERRLERRTLMRAREIVTVSEPLARDLAALHRKPVTVVSNGFDPGDEVAVAPERRLPLDARRFTIVHTGTLLHGTRDPAALFVAVGELLRSGALTADQVEVWLLGRNLEIGQRALVGSPTLAASVHFEPSVPRDVALAAQRDATVLLVLESPRPEHAGIVTGKVFEYLAAERPILAFGPRGGALDALLRETGGGVLVTSAAEAAASLLRWAREFQASGRVMWRGNREAVARYHRRALAGRFATVLERVTPAAGAAGAIIDPRERRD